MASGLAKPEVHVGTGAIPENLSMTHHSTLKSNSGLTNKSTKRIGMVDSHLSSVASLNASGIGHLYNDSNWTDPHFNGSKKNEENYPANKMDTDDPAPRNMYVKVSPESENAQELSPEIPGLSIITWEEFIEDPSLLHNLFSIDRSEFIDFDSNVVNSFFHDSRMDPPLLGGPSGDGLSWTIFVDSYTELRTVRDMMTTRISVLLVDLVKPNNGGTASCLVAINPMDDQIRRVLHLTLSRAMETVFANRSFSIEINLNENVQQWCQAVLQMDCQVLGGRIVVTNGDPVEPFCQVDSPVFCVLAFPVWLYRRVKYITQRKRLYDDTFVEFDGANFTLCTKSETLRHNSEVKQLSSGNRLIHRNANAVTAATQTLNTSTPSLTSEMSVQEIDEASDNDVMKRRGLAPGIEADSYRVQANPAFEHEDEKVVQREDNSKVKFELDQQTDIHPEGNDSLNTNASSHYKLENQQITPSHLDQNNLKKAEGIRSIFEENIALDRVAQENNINESCKNYNTIQSAEKAAQKVLKSSAEVTASENVPSPRSAFLQRPYTPFQPTPKPRKGKGKVETSTVNSSDISPNNSSPRPGDINDKIVRRQRKISNLLKDLISFNSPTYNVALEDTDDIRGEENDNERVNSPRFIKHNVLLSKAKSPAKPPRKTSNVVRTSLNDSKNSSVFPYTSDLLNFPVVSPNENPIDLEKYGARLKKEPKKKQSNRTDDMLFLPRLNLDEVNPDRNCFSDQDIADSDVTDLEQEPEGAVSDTEGVLSSRLIPVYSTERTLSLDSVENDIMVNQSKNDLDSDLEITDCEVDEMKYSKDLSSPRILPGALAAKQLRSMSAHSRSGDYIPPNAQLNNRRGGTQNDSRRRYLALNSLRRKAYNLALQSQVRSQKRPTSAELVSYDARRPNSSNITIISKV